MIAPVHLLLTAVLAGVLALCVLGSLARSGMAGIADTMRANVLLVLSMPLLALQQYEAPLWLCVILANAGVALALCAYFSGLRRALGLRVPRRLMALCCAAALGALVYYTYAAPSMPRRVAAMSCLMLAFMLGTAASARRAMPNNRSGYSYRYVWWVGVALAAVCGGRAVLYLAEVMQAQNALDLKAWNAVFMVPSVLAMPCLTMGTIMIIHDRMLAEREREANTDFLTGLMSRKAWWLQAERCCAHALRTRRPLALMLLDIDHFKQINDALGHAAGDAVLRHFGLLATATLRAGDHVGRVGGEEFGVLFPDMRAEAAMEAAGRLLASVRRTPCSHADGTISYTFSAGVADWVPGENLQGLYARADRALYAAKAAGRNRVEGPGAPAQSLAAAA